MTSPQALASLATLSSPFSVGRFRVAVVELVESSTAEKVRLRRGFEDVDGWGSERGTWATSSSVWVEGTPARTCTVSTPPQAGHQRVPTRKR